MAWFPRDAVSPLGEDAPEIVAYTMRTALATSFPLFLYRSCVHVDYRLCDIRREVFVDGTAGVQASVSDMCVSASEREEGAIAAAAAGPGATSAAREAASLHDNIEVVIGGHKRTLTSAEISGDAWQCPSRLASRILPTHGVHLSDTAAVSQGDRASACEILEHLCRFTLEGCRFTHEAVSEMCRTKLSELRTLRNFEAVRLYARLVVVHSDDKDSLQADGAVRPRTLATCSALLASLLLATCYLLLRRCD